MKQLVNWGVQRWREHKLFLGKFILVGTSGVVVDFGVYILLTRASTWWANYFIAANVIASLLANINNFWWNRVRTFQSQSGALARQYLRFVTASALYIGALQLGLWFSVRVLGWHDLASKLAALMLFFPMYFLVVKSWVFNDNLVLNYLTSKSKV